MHADSAGYSPGEKEAQLCTKCVNLLARAMCAHVNHLDAVSMSLPLGVFGGLVQRGYLDAT